MDTANLECKELSDSLDKTLTVGHFAVIDLENDDSLYRLRLGLVKITGVEDNTIDFKWYTYVGYPSKQDPSYSDTWVLQVLAGPGQRVDTGSCSAESVVLTFPKLTKKKTIPAVGRTAPLKMITRALNGEFGPLPADVVNDDVGSESDYLPDKVESSSDEDAPLIRGGACATLRRSKRLHK